MDDGKKGCELLQSCIAL